MPQQEANLAIRDRLILLFIGAQATTNSRGRKSSYGGLCRKCSNSVILTQLAAELAPHSLLFRCSPCPTPIPPHKRPSLPPLPLFQRILLYIPNCLPQMAFIENIHTPRITCPRRWQRRVTLVNFTKRMQTVGKQLLRRPSLQMPHDSSNTSPVITDYKVRMLWKDCTCVDEIVAFFNRISKTVCYRQCLFARELYFRILQCQLCRFTGFDIMRF